MSVTLAIIWLPFGAGCKFEHVSSCDVDNHVREWIRKVHEPQSLFCNMLDRDWNRGGVSFDEKAGRETPVRCGPDIYVAGFPCTPYSCLNFESEGIEAEAAKPLFATMEYIHKARPRTSQ